MTDAKTANIIHDRLEGKDRLEDPLEFQRLAHDFSGDLIAVDTSAKIRNSILGAYEELDLLLEDYCSNCKLEETCDWTKDVRRAAGENYSFWLSGWPAIEFSYEGETFPMSGATVMCTHYQSQELEDKGIDVVNHPLSRLIQIIENKKKSRQ